MIGPIHNVHSLIHTDFHGFYCENNRCGAHITGRWPVRRGGADTIGPYFCSIKCAWQASYRQDERDKAKRLEQNLAKEIPNLPVIEE